MSGTIGAPTTVLTSDGNFRHTFVGSVDAPQRIDVNTRFPERNFPFVVHEVPSVSVGGLTVSVYDISTIADPPDANRYRMRVPPGPPHNRILARIPSLRHWHTNQLRYQAALGDYMDANTRTAHINTENAITENPEERGWFSVMLVFPQNVDNVILSQSRNVVRVLMNPIVDTPVEAGQQLIGTSLIWRIAIREETDRSTTAPTPVNIQQQLAAATARAARADGAAPAHGEAAPAEMDLGN